MQDLTLSSFSSSTRLLNVDRLCTAEANWPKLHSLTLGSFGYNDDFELNSPSDDAAFGAFLSKHTELKYLRLSWNFKRWMSPETIPLSLEPTALPQLSTFVGVHQQLAVLPQPALSSIEILDLTCEPLFAGRLDGVGGVCSTLARLSALTSLDLWLHIPEFKDHSTFFKGLMEACPKLTELHFMCTTSFGVVHITFTFFCPFLVNYFVPTETSSVPRRSPSITSTSSYLFAHKGAQIRRRRFKHAAHCFKNLTRQHKIEIRYFE